MKLIARLAALILFAGLAGSLQAQGGSGITKDDFFVEGLAPVRKSGPYDVTIVYFMDYQCPSCRQYTPDVSRALNEDRRVRVIYRDTPILGPRSEAAARAAIGSQFQGRHEQFHHALMTTKGTLDEAAVRAAAAKAGVDWDRLQRDLKARRDDIDMVIARNFELATEIGIVGTPAFIVGESQADGALTYAALKAEIADARKTLGIAPPASAPQVGASEAAAAEREVAPAAAGEQVAASPAAPVFQPAKAMDQPKAPPVSRDDDDRGPLGWVLLAALGLATIIAATAMFRRAAAR